MSEILNLFDDLFIPEEVSVDFIIVSLNRPAPGVWMSPSAVI